MDHRCTNIWAVGFNTYAYVVRYEITRFCENSTLFFFLEATMLFSSVSTLFYIPIAVDAFPTSPCDCQYWLFSVFWVADTILKGRKVYLDMALICFLILIVHLEYLAVYLLAICVATLKKHLFIFKGEMLSYEFFGVILSTESKSNVWGVNILSHSVK